MVKSCRDLISATETAHDEEVISLGKLVMDCSMAAFSHNGNEVLAGEDGVAVRLDNSWFFTNSHPHENVLVEAI